MDVSEPSNQVNYYADVRLKDQIAELGSMLGLSREDPGARLPCSNTGLSFPNLDHTTMLSASTPPPCNTPKCSTFLVHSNQ